MHETQGIGAVRRHRIFCEDALAHLHDGDESESAGRGRHRQRELPINAASIDAFDVWFRAHAQQMHGIDLAAGMNLPEQVLDHTA